MDNLLTNRLCLGTAQFGLAYGIANMRGRMPHEEVFEILRYALDNGIYILDTASAYGESERIIGEFTKGLSPNFKIISKLPQLDKSSIDIAGFAQEKLRNTLLDLRTDSIYGYLIHDFNDFYLHDDLWVALESLKKERVVQRIGFSLYKPDELEFILSKKITFDIVQIPYSVFDRRLEPYFNLLKNKNVEIFVRSVFLQGLAFMSPDALPDQLHEARSSLIRLNEIASNNKVSINALCLNFVLENRFVDKVIIGVDSLKHLEKNINDIESMRRTDELSGALRGLIITNENILLPYNWSIK